MEITRKLLGNDYLPSISINALDYSKEMNAIRQTYGPRYFDSVEAIQAASNLWGIKCNEFGIAAERAEPFVIKTADRYLVEITPSDSPNGKHLIGVNTQTPISGFSYAPSVFSSLGYPSIEDTRIAGIYEAGSYLEHRLKHPCSCSSQSYRDGMEKLLRKLEEATQPSLF